MTQRAQSPTPPVFAAVSGQTYCFGSKEALGVFMQNPKDNLAKAPSYYSKKHPG